MTNFQPSASATGDVQLISRGSAASLSSVVYIAAGNGYLMEAAVSICLQTARCITVLKIFTAVCHVSSRGTCILFGLSTISCMSHNKVQLDMQL